MSEGQNSSTSSDPSDVALSIALREEWPNLDLASDERVKYMIYALEVKHADGTEDGKRWGIDAEPVIVPPKADKNVTIVTRESKQKISYRQSNSCDWYCELQVLIVRTEGDNSPWEIPIHWPGGVGTLMGKDVEVLSLSQFREFLEQTFENEPHKWRNQTEKLEMVAGTLRGAASQAVKAAISGIGSTLSGRIFAWGQIISFLRAGYGHSSSTADDMNVPFTGLPPPGPGKDPFKAVPFIECLQFRKQILLNLMSMLEGGEPHAIMDEVEDLDKFLRADTYSTINVRIRATHSDLIFTHSNSWSQDWSDQVADAGTPGKKNSMGYLPRLAQCLKKELTTDKPMQYKVFFTNPLDSDSYIDWQWYFVKKAGHFELSLQVHRGDRP